jgi:hypothetical protein
MKTHFIAGLIIGAAINLAFQLTDRPLTQARLDLWELSLCSLLPALAALLVASFSKAVKDQHTTRHCPSAPPQTLSQNSR